jgi:iron complex outermembrane receptor protein
MNINLKLSTLSLAILVSLFVCAPVLAQDAAEETPAPAPAPEPAPAPAPEETPPAAAAQPTGAELGLSPEEAAGLAAQEEEVEEIVVTGSRIQRSNLEDFAHITVLSSDEIIKSGAKTVDDLLNKLPSVTLQGINKQQNNGGNGLAFVDLRNLGVGRTLVLVNGKRFINSATGAGVDLNNIPVPMIERVEVLLDGASAVYGSDAIAGVINIILKDNFEGMQFDLGGGITSRGDGAEIEVAMTGGAGSEKGNFTANITYYHRDKIWQKDRAWAHYPAQLDVWSGMGQKPYRVQGSGNPIEGRIFFCGDDPGCGYDFYFPTDKEGNVSVDWFNRQARYNFADYQWLVGTLERYQLTVNGHYKLSDKVKAFMEGTYTRRWSRNQLAPQPLGFGTNAFPDPLFIADPMNNPYLPQAVKDMLGPADLGGIWMYKRTADIGPRIYDNNSDTFRIVTGVKGEITKRLGWELFLDLGHHQNLITIYNSINLKRFNDILNPAACAQNANTGCVLGNVFGLGTMSEASKKYVRYIDEEVTNWEQFTVGGSVSGNLGDLFELPAGPVGVALGFELRKELGYNHPSPTTTGGEASGNGLDPTEGTYNVQEVFAEASIPLFKNIPGAYLANIDLAGRFSRYNTFGSDFTWRTGLQYAPIRDLRLRGVLSTAFRAPSIADLYGGAADSYEELRDPCNHWGSLPDSPTNNLIKQKCQEEGVPPDFDQVAAGGSQIRTNVGGNPNLDAETAMVWNVGMVLLPSFVPDWMAETSVTFDYYNAKVDNAITTPTPQWILDSCYDGTNPANCDLINPGSAVKRNNKNNIPWINASLQNFATLKTDGLDITADIHVNTRKLGLPVIQGVILNWHGNYLLHYQEKDNAGNEINYEGKIQYGAGSFARFRWNLMLTLAGEGWSVGNRIRYIGGAQNFDATKDEATGLWDMPVYKVPAVAYWDIVLTYNFKEFEWLFGVDNVLDKDPPYLPEGSQNANTLSYDALGTYFWTKLSYKF